MPKAAGINFFFSFAWSAKSEKKYIRLKKLEGEDGDEMEISSALHGFKVFFFFL